MIHVYRMSETNVGDMSCCPADYFDLPGERMDIVNLDRGKLRRNEIVIVGGGGLFHFPEMADILSSGSKVVGWGIGTNTHDRTDAHYPVDLLKFSLLGLRDAGPGCVPCVSCMSPLFDKPDEPKHEIVVYHHLDAPIDLPYPTRSNVPDFADAVSFLASGRAVITNAYHGWYWATLLRRRVIMYQPFSSRHFNLPFPCPTAYHSEELEAAMRLTETYNVLDECRGANLTFVKKVRNLALFQRRTRSLLK